MQWVIGVLLVIIVGIVIWFFIPWSPMKAEFARLRNSQNASLASSGEVFTKEELASLPVPLQKYFEACGYIGKPQMFNIKMTHSDVNFILSSSMPALKIKSTQYNSADKPERVALLETRLYGIPFEGLDSYSNGVGSMKGVLAKVIPLFDQRGESMNRAGLVTWLAESPMLPAAMLQDFISWEEVDDTHVKATISWNGISAEGVFTFDESGAVASFQTVDRVATDMNGNEQFVAWSAIYDEYRPVNGILRPTVIQSVWHYPEGDLVYFNENKRPVSIECE
jgi:hypothetical protein